jgi:hypothetical protein
MPTRQLFTCTAFWFLISMAPAQETPPESPAEEVEFRQHLFSVRYAKLIGTWVNETTTEDGDIVRTVHEYRWILDDRFVRRLVTVTTNDEAPSSQETTIGVDALTGQDRFWGFDSNGCYWESVDSLCHEGKQWVIKFVGRCGEQSNSWTETVELAKGTYTVKVRDQLLAGQLLLPDSEPLEFRRQD